MGGFWSSDLVVPATYRCNRAALLNQPTAITTLGCRKEGFLMNALELHLLTSIADSPGLDLDEFEPCRRTLSVLEARGLITIERVTDRQVFQITDEGLGELRRELRRP